MVDIINEEWYMQATKTKGEKVCNRDKSTAILIRAN
jgi:hypothetical protein